MKEISQAIIKVMEEINWVAKNMTVWTWTNAYKWVSDKDVKEAIRDSMIKNWLSILPIWVNPKIQVDRWEEDDTYNKQPPYPKKTKQSIFTEVETKYLLLHTSWDTIELSWYGQGVDSQDKWAGKATTYALKNTLLNMFLVPTWVDTDNTHSDDLPVPPKKTEKPYFNDPQYKLFVENNRVNHYSNSKQAIDKIRETYRLGKEMESNIVDLFVDNWKD